MRRGRRRRRFCCGVNNIFIGDSGKRNLHRRGSRGRRRPNRSSRRRFVGQLQSFNRCPELGQKALLLVLLFVVVVVVVLFQIEF
jgi:hypothetical protein